MEMGSLMRMSWKLSSRKRSVIRRSSNWSGSASYETKTYWNDMPVFVLKLKKVYNSDNEEDDMVEMEEERLRMREHVMNEVKHRCHCTHVVWCPGVD